LFVVENINHFHYNGTAMILARFKAILQASRTFVAQAVKRL